jgi:hypothetical protein
MTLTLSPNAKKNDEAITHAATLARPAAVVVPSDEIKDDSAAPIFGSIFGSANDDYSPSPSPPVLPWYDMA